MKEINLFKIRREASEEKIRKKRLIKVISILILVFYCLVMAGIFSYWLILKKEKNQVVSKIKLQENKIKELKLVESQNTLVKQRLSALIPHLAKEKIDYQEIMGKLKMLVPEGVVLKNISIDQKGNLQISGDGANAYVFINFVEQLLASDNEDFAENIVLSSTKRQNDGIYSFSLEINVKT